MGRLDDRHEEELGSALVWENRSSLRLVVEEASLFSSSVEALELDNEKKILSRFARKPTNWFASLFSIYQ